VSTIVLCDRCGEKATYRITAIPVNDVVPPPNPESVGIDTCDEHYSITHPGRVGGGWWDDFPAPQRLSRMAPREIEGVPA
jgi:hypothetical protein